ncbi:MAG: hypothetical protein Q7T74_01185 [Candidatus Saccharibacteria bacterium]|nr:hypothetical protein [Candidatus Saccharibacteria bacterium]
MSTKKQTVIINGKTYDMATGKPTAGPHQATAKVRVINDIAPQPQRSATVAQKTRNVAPHARTTPQKSTTLRRDILKKPASKTRPNASKVHRSVQKSDRITKFAPTKHHTAPKKSGVDYDLAAQTKALEQAHIEHLQAKSRESAHISSRVIKEHLLGQAVEKVPAESINSHQKSHTSRRPRFASAAMTSLAMVMLGGYLTYINIPNLSIRVAAASTGINANLPAYQPAGYRIHGPISYNDGEINVSYKANSGNTGYNLAQRPTDWDPIATLDNYVEADSKNDYQIHSVQGLTVYTYGKKAVWVNGGILHVIDGTATLSNQQVERIVASM